MTESKRMRKFVISDNLSVGTVNAGLLNPVQLGVAPVNVLVLAVKRQTIWPKIIVTKYNNQKQTNINTKQVQC